MRTYLFAAILIIQSICFGNERFMLESELRTTYSGGSAVSAFTAYHYDNEGNRTQRRVFDGIDSTTVLMSTIAYSYDADTRCTEELLMDAGRDTLSIVRYFYSTEGLVNAVTLRKDGSVRFSDSLRYESGVLREQRRYNSAGTLSWYHRYGYQDGLLASDSLFEPGGEGEFIPTQALLISHNEDSTVASEAHWRFSGGQWYIMSTTMMGYAGTCLVSATTFEGDGSSLRLMDSLAYTVDSYGNRTLELCFDNERSKTYEIVYTWHDTQPETSIAKVQRTECGNVVWQNGRLEFDKAVSGNMILCRLDGCRVHAQQFQKETSVCLPYNLCAGNYIALFTGDVNRSFSIIINN